MNFETQKVCQFWVEHPSKFVKINEQKMKELAQLLQKNRPRIPDWRIPELPSFDRAFVSHLFYICAIDFAFTHFTPPHRSFYFSSEIRGSAAASMCFLRHFGNYEISAEEILAISTNPRRLESFFKGKNLPPLLEQRGICLEEAACVLIKIFNGSVFNFLEFSRYETWKIISNLVNYFPVAFGQDRYRDLYLNKRAHLFPLIYHGRALHSNGLLRPLKQPRDIGPIPDYQVPKYLRAIGILQYTSSLDKKIAARKILTFGSAEEMEIRVATVYAVCRLMNLTGLTMPELDYWLWQGGQKIQHLNHHLTPTTAY